MYCWFLSLRYLRSRRTNWIGVAGIFVAVTALILILSIMSGFLSEARGHLRGNLADMIIQPRLSAPVGPTGVRIHRDVGPMLELIEKDPRVESACPQLVWYGMLAPEHGSQALQDPMFGDIALVNLVGIDVEAEYATSDLRESLLAEPHHAFRVVERVEDIEHPFAPPPFHEPDGGPVPSILIGVQLASAWGLHRGQELEIVTASIDVETGSVGDPSNMTFVVAGTFRTGQNEMDLERVYMEREVLADFLGRDVAWSQVLVKLHNYEEHKREVSTDLKRQLFEAGYLHAPNDPFYSNYELRTWEDFRGMLLGAIENEKALMGVMLSLVMVVAGFTVFAILSMMVSEKRRDIGVLCALGATPRGILLLFLLIGCWEAVLGAALGTGLGIWSAIHIDGIETWLSKLFGVQIFNRDVYLFDHIPAVIEPYGVGAIVLGAVLCTLLFAAIPAWRASRLHPIDALRYE
ncbi:MAG: FtsX-like permease family protein [Planctomycetota bacterium]